MPGRRDNGESTQASRRRRAVRVLEERGAGTVPHLRGNLLDHLVRTEQLLERWGASAELCLAGLCHAAYGTDGFEAALFGLDERGVLSTAVGSDVEGIVYFYAACDRAFLYPQIGAVGASTFRDRFTGARSTPSEVQFLTFVDLTLANEADIATSGHTSKDVPTWFASMVDQFGSAASGSVAEACRHLVAPNGSPGR